MNQDSDKNVEEPDAAYGERERIRRQRIADLKATLDRIGAEAQARGMTEEILNEIVNEILNEAPTVEEAAETRARVEEMRAVVAEFSKRQLP